MKKILFICSGNTCRSAMAQGVFNSIADKKNLDAVAESAGAFTVDGLYASALAVEVCRENGVDITNHISRKVTRKILDGADIIVPFCAAHREMIKEICTDCTKIKPPAEISDPYGGSIEIYRKCFKQITGLCEGICDEL